MGQYNRIAVIVTVLFSLVMLSSKSVWAQPLRMLSQQPQQKPQYGCLSSAGGRFVFGQISDSSKDRFMLDTFSGRLWRISKSGKVGIFLESVQYRVGEGKYAPLPGHISDSAPKETEKE